MNFKNITKFAVAALLFTSISALAQGPVYLHIQNNTDDDFNIQQKKPDATRVYRVLRGKETNITQLPVSIFNQAFFSFITDSGAIPLLMKFSTEPYKPIAKVQLILPTGKMTEVTTNLPGANPPGYDYHIFLTLSGNKENNFDKSSLNLEAMTHEMTLKLERKQIEIRRLKERLPERTLEQSIEHRLLPMVRH